MGRRRERKKSYVYSHLLDKTYIHEIVETFYKNI